MNNFKSFRYRKKIISIYHYLSFEFLIGIFISYILYINNFPTIICIFSGVFPVFFGYLMYNNYSG